MKNKRLKKALKIFLSVILCIALVFGILGCISSVRNKTNSDFIKSRVEPVTFGNQLIPNLDDEGSYEFITDREFRIMHLTDIHIGAGFLSTEKDNRAINCVAAMISAEKPDLVIVTGDIAFPVPYSAGTLNNKRAAILFAELMEKLGVYWCLAYGNHDTEAYSYYSREQISEIYSDRDKYPHCLFQTGPENTDGCGNYVITIKNTDGRIIQSLFMLDSHSYTDKDYFGILWKYDCVHENQVEWYKNKILSLTKQNRGITPNSLMFMHIPIIEMRDAYNEFIKNKNSDTSDVKYKDGQMGEKDIVVYSSEYNYGLFDECLNLKSTKGIFFGHDHLNNMNLNYKGITLSYGYSVDYLAYSKINEYGAQRGCQIITVNQNGSFDTVKENYYQDKYKSINPKEEVTMDKYYK